MLTKIKNIVDNYPNNIAYAIDNETISYKKLWDMAYEYSLLLKKQGVGPVIIYGHKEINVIIAIIACIMANRTYVPIDINTPLCRIKKIIELTNSSLLIKIDDIMIDNINCCTLDELNQYSKEKNKEDNNDIVYIIFTSGSTGIPKGVPISKNNLNNFINWISNLKPLNNYHNINVLNQASFSFDLSVADFYYSLCNGHTLVALSNNNDYDKLYKILKKMDAAVMTPTFIKLLLLNSDFNYLNYSNFKCIYFCGEQLEVNTVKKIYERFPNINIINAYGPTEATSAVSATLIEKDMLNNKILPVGNTNNFATTIEIINNEIVLKGNSVFNGYIGNIVGGYYKEKNINCYKTGDIGYIDNNLLYCKGRIDNQIKYKGYRIELSEIEYYINNIEEVDDCAVIAKYNDDGIVKSIKAFIVTNKQDNTYIKEVLKKHIPDYMIPKTIVFIEKLPINKNGKIDRKVLSEL